MDKSDKSDYYTLNFKIPPELHQKLLWLSNLSGEYFAVIVRGLIEDAYQEKKASYENDQLFIRWVRAQNRK